MPRIPNNRDLFAERGDPWEGREKSRQPVTSPAGNVRMPFRAHLYSLTTPAVDRSDVPSDNPDFDRYLAAKAEPFCLRLARERNKLLPSMNKKISSRKSLSPQTKTLINLRTKLNKTK